MCAVDHVGDLLGSRVGRVVVWGVLGDLNVLLEHPHLYLLLEQVWVASGIFGDNLSNGRAPAERSKNVHISLAGLDDCDE